MFFSLACYICSYGSTHPISASDRCHTHCCPERPNYCKFLKTVLAANQRLLRCYQSTLANQTVQHSTAIFTVPSHLRFHPCKCQSSSVWKLQARRRRGAPPLACIFTVFKPGECCSVIMLCNTDRSSKRCKQRSGVLGLGVRNVTNSILMQQNEHQSQNASLKYMLTTQMTRTQSRPSCQYYCGEPLVKVG